MSQKTHVQDIQEDSQSSLPLRAVREALDEVREHCRRHLCNGPHAQHGQCNLFTPSQGGRCAQDDAASYEAPGRRQGVERDREARISVGLEC